MKNNCRTTVMVSSFFLAFAIVFLIGCKGPETQPPVDRSQLSEDEKRLPANALSTFKVTDGLEVGLFASEPMMLNPTNMDIDHKGRIWITEGYNYRYDLNPGHPHKDSGDRILILEDTDGDGKADSSKVFYQDSSINAALGIAVFGNKVIVSCSPNVFIFTDENGDDKPDKKEILFQGIGGVQHDHAIHAFTFGPDGKLYFNFGNAGKSILDKNGNVVNDVEGTPVNASGKPYRQGMVFRCDLDGSNFEVLANNFRNNYEVAVDAFGSLWQSDNDDDGNRGVRINYVMEYGNYGFTDEMTGAGWQSRRTNMEDSIPFRHWHLNDPGVVPNLLQTGSGSPTGMLVYEGNLLPKKFDGQMIHAEPGHNVVRSYPVTKSGAGFTADTVNILKSTDDSWFRPSDVCIAPDGSLFIADWYDPGVGGHQVRDLERGRIFRVAPDIATYKVPSFSVNNTGNAIEALESPNLATRYMAWQKLHEMGTSAEQALADVFNDSDNPRFRARAFWLLTKLPGKGPAYVTTALKDKDEDIRIASVRAARELKMDMIPIVKQLMNESAQVRRELLIALRHNASPESPQLWAQLAEKYDGKDRWYLEALGISADKQWDTYFDAWLKLVGDKWNSERGRDIVWRSRAKAALPLLAKIIQDPARDPSANLKFFRSFDFHTDSSKQQVLISLLNGDHPTQKLVTVYALKQLDTANLVMNTSLKSTIYKSLETVRGQQDFVDLVAKFKIKDQNQELLNIALKNERKETRTSALRLLVANDGQRVLNAAVHKDTGSGMILLTALDDDSRKTKDLLESLVLDKSLALSLKRKATEMLHKGYNGQERLMNLVTQKKLPSPLDTTAERLLLNSWRQDVKQKALAHYRKGGDTHESLQPVSALIKLAGKPDDGKEVFNITCNTCHQVNNTGTNFGPDLSEIGAKYQKEGLYNSILEPDAGISFGYEGYIITTKDGNQMVGYITSETKDEISLKVMGGQVNKVKKSDLVSKKAYGHSLMPAGLASTMKQQQLVDLVEYLTTLKKKK